MLQIFQCALVEAGQGAWCGLVDECIFLFAQVHVVVAHR
jgi:hypothetical protein